MRIAVLMENGDQIVPSTSSLLFQRSGVSELEQITHISSVSERFSDTLDSCCILELFARGYLTLVDYSAIHSLSQAYHCAYLSADHYFNLDVNAAALSLRCNTL